MSDLSVLFDRRSKSYSNYNKKIFKILLNNVIPAILDRMSLSDQELDKLEWTNVQVVEDFLVITGTIRYEEGDIISDDDTVVTLDGALALMLDKVLRASIPFELACNGSKHDVIEHLKAAEQKLRDEYETIYGHEPETLQDAMFEAMRGQIGIDIGQIGMDIGPEFNYNDLTEEQREAYYMWGVSHDAKGGKPN